MFEKLEPTGFTFLLKVHHQNRRWWIFCLFVNCCSSRDHWFFFIFQHFEKESPSRLYLFNWKHFFLTTTVTKTVSLLVSTLLSPPCWILSAETVSVFTQDEDGSAHNQQTKPWATHRPDSKLWHWSMSVLTISNRFWTRLCSSALFHRTSFRFQLDKLLGHLVGRPLGQDTHHGHARLVGVNAWPERAPAHAALPVGDVTQLNHSHADHSVCSAEAVILHCDLELVAVWGFLTQDTAEQRRKLRIRH